MSKITEEKVGRAYSAALQYGPEPFNHESRAHHAMLSEKFGFIITMKDSDMFPQKAYHVAGKMGVGICCVDWMQDVAEETDGMHEFCDALIEGYSTPDTTGYYICRTREGKRVAHTMTEAVARKMAGQLQSETGDLHHYYDTSDEEVTLDE